MTTLVTGASGFIGSALCQTMRDRGMPVRAATRSPFKSGDAIDRIQVGDLSAKADWNAALKNAHSIIHLSARVHVMNDRSTNPLAEFHRINVDGTANLARQAASAGVSRFVFLSSIKVNGESTCTGKPFRFDDVPEPKDPYGRSKLEAEQVLTQIAAQTGMEVVIIRPPLVYGPGVKANFEAMMRWLEKGWPLPLGAATKNRRSLIALDNLVDLILTCVTHPAAANNTFLASDGEDLSTADLLRRIGLALGRPAHLVPVPTKLLNWGASVIGKQSIYQRLCGSLQVDITNTQHLLDWTPPLTVDEGLRRAAQGLTR